MELPEAWATFGRDFSAIVAEAKARPREERVAYLEGLLEEARRVKKALQGAHHPDRGGDAAMFKRVAQAFEAIEKGTEEFKAALAEAEARKDSVPDNRVRIRIDPLG